MKTNPFTVRRMEKQKSSNETNSNLESSMPWNARFAKIYFFFAWLENGCCVGILGGTLIKQKSIRILGYIIYIYAISTSYLIKGLMDMQSCI